MSNEDFEDEFGGFEVCFYKFFFKNPKNIIFL
jgi:hypothetical protein